MEEITCQKCCPSILASIALLDLNQRKGNCECQYLLLFYTYLCTISYCPFKLGNTESYKEKVHISCVPSVCTWCRPKERPFGYSVGQEQCAEDLVTGRLGIFSQKCPIVFCQVKKPQLTYRDRGEGEEEGLSLTNSRIRL